MRAAGQAGTLDLAVRAAASLAGAHLERRDRVGVCRVRRRAALARAVARQTARCTGSPTHCCRPRSCSATCGRRVAMIPPRLLPAGALVIALTPLLDQRAPRRRCSTCARSRLRPGDRRVLAGAVPAAARLGHGGARAAAVAAAARPRCGPAFASSGVRRQSGRRLTACRCRSGRWSDLAVAPGRSREPSCGGGGGRDHRVACGVGRRFVWHGARRGRTGDRLRGVRGLRAGRVLTPAPALRAGRVGEADRSNHGDRCIRTCGIGGRIARARGREAAGATIRARDGGGRGGGRRRDLAGGTVCGGAASSARA